MQVQAASYQFLPGMQNHDEDLQVMFNRSYLLYKLEAEKSRPDTNLMSMLDENKIQEPQ